MIERTHEHKKQTIERQKEISNNRTDRMIEQPIDRKTDRQKEQQTDKKKKNE